MTRSGLPIDRRTLLGRSTALLGVGAAAAAVHGSPTTAPPPPPPSPPPPVTRILARYLVDARHDDLPAAVRHEGVRTFLNWVGCAVGGSGHETIDRAIRALAPFAGRPEAVVLGRAERFDALTAAFLTGVASHIFDYDDTHLKTIIHPAGPVASAILALAQHRRVDGAAFLLALSLGVETECRIGNAVYPEHYAAGWHITGTCGVFGAAAACGKLLGLDEAAMTRALSIAASQPVGLKIQFGTMTKSFHPGRAAQNGMTAALLAEQGFTADAAAIEGKDGWGQALSTRHDWHEVTEGLGTRYEAQLNTYKPFACGIVCHPAIDAAIQLRDENHLRAGDIAAVRLRANPLVASLTGKTNPKTGLEGKFSIYHCVAVALLQDAAGERQFSDAAVLDPATIALRRKVTLAIDPQMPPEQCDLTIRLTDGRVLTRHIAHAVGSVENPLSDAMLAAKFRDLARDVLPPDQVGRLLDRCWGVESIANVATIAAAAATSAT